MTGTQKLYLHTAFSLVAIAVIHFIADLYGIYDTQEQSGIVWFDNVLHFLVGIVLAHVLMHKVERRYPSRKYVWNALYTVCLVLLLALVWESLEYGFLRLFPLYAVAFELYSPSLIEATEDILSNMIGGLFVLMFQSLLSGSSRIGKNHTDYDDNRND